MTKTYLFVIPWSLEAVGGVNRVVLSLCEQISAGQVFQPVVLICDWSAAAPIWGEVNGVTTVRMRVPTSSPQSSPIRRVGHFLRGLRFKRDFLKILREHSVAVVNFHYPVGSTIRVCETIFQLRVRPCVICSFHGTDVENLRKASDKELQLWKALRPNLDAVVACSGNLATRVDEVLGGGFTTNVIYNGVDYAGFFLGNRQTAPRGRRIVLHIGKYDSNKGQEVLLRAYDRLQQKWPDVDLLFVGANGGTKPILEAMVSNMGFSEKVNFLVDIPHRDVCRVLQEAELFVLSSRKEAFPLVLLEAGAAGVPVIASRTGGIPEIIQDGKTGVLVTPGDPSQLAERLDELLSNPARARALASNLQTRVRDDFSWAKACAHYLEIARKSSKAT